MNKINHIIHKLIDPFMNPDNWQKWIEQIIIGILYIVIAFIVIKLLQKVVEKFFTTKYGTKRVGKSDKRAKTLVNLIQNIISYVVWFIVATTILGNLGIRVESIIAGAGVVGLAIGFGAQTLVKDVITGFFIIFENQFDVGDYVRINTTGTTVAEGTVQSIGMRSTRILSFAGDLTILPNGTMNEIVNFSIHNGMAIVEIPVSNNEDLDVVESKLEKFLPTIKEKYEIFIKDPEILGVEAVTSSESTIKVTGETEPNTHATGARILRREIKSFFDRENIKVPSPTMVSYNPKNIQ
ncbi:mechanosensitive ion channel family protein [Mammaliicoccus stepanovicii]|uniref:Transporter, small conductance mechanosensitive ion channel (MscS) family n=1 Tax=Mammaliicoccus stepanovicii TaxID=643214 RepID=A0A240AEY0_9STAP|nr:mechanosensitive ion channel family protein [Mammaliicoccus stepanovicii]PNZ77757.1 mechanosensitive ion channel protein MscS [Mammaliicoccus stepanovicii]GGI42845.1 mechanosensitive ion channel protein MscS [Mammaliicoccus stepanovicii]SNV81830.1 transporter, small conductance mechanosensitive ion channel (MscS) family [Mammaliicoccus stepanovicii]